MMWVNKTITKTGNRLEIMIMRIDKELIFAESMGEDPACKRYIANMAYRITRGVTRHASSFALLAATVLSVPAIVITTSATAGDAALSELSCHPLLTSAECRAYKTGMAKAATPRDRNLLKNQYELLLVERGQLCPCPSGKEWPRLN